MAICRVVRVQAGLIVEQIGQNGRWTLNDVCDVSTDNGQRRQRKGRLSREEAETVGVRRAAPLHGPARLDEAKVGSLLPRGAGGVELADEADEREQ